MYLACYVIFTTVILIIEQYLEYRQWKKNHEKEIPANVRSLVTKEEFEATQVYSKDKRELSIVHAFVGFIVGKLFLIFLNPYAWNSVAFLENEYTRTLVWLLILHWADKPIELPFSIYSHFVVEEKHGFNKMTKWTFFTDLLKSEAITYVMSAILIPCMIWIIRNCGESFYLYLWAFTQMVFLIVIIWLFPCVIQPMFNKFEPLQDEELRKKIEELAASLKFPLTKLFQIDGSKRSSHSNAYFTGFWKNKRIVLFDTLLHLDHKEILAILGHELGHWHHNHMLFNHCFTSVNLFVIFWMFGQVMYGSHAGAIVVDFGFPEGTNACLIFLTLFMYLITPVFEVISRVSIMISRIFEFQADRFASKLGHGTALMEGLKHINKENKADLCVDPWYSWYVYSHPPLTERLAALEALEKRKDE